MFVEGSRSWGGGIVESAVRTAARTDEIRQATAGG